MKSHTPSTYSLLVRSESEEANRSILETLLYVSFFLSAIFAIWQFSLQPVTVPAAGLRADARVACAERTGGQC